MKYYEVMIIFLPDLEKKIYAETMERFAKDISEHKGKLENWQVWAEKRSLAHLLQSKGAERKKYDAGTYILADFELGEEALKRLKYLLTLEESILRFVILRKEHNG